MRCLYEGLEAFKVGERIFFTVLKYLKRKRKDE